MTYCLGSAFVALTLTLAPIQVQEPIEKLTAVQPSPQQDAATFRIKAGEHNIVDLIEKSGKFLGRQYLLDKSQNPAMCQTDSAASKIKIAMDVDLSPEACEEFVGQVLYSKGWIAVPLDREKGIYDWVHVQGPKARGIKTHCTEISASELRARPRVVEYVSTIVNTKHMPAQLASAQMRVFYNDPNGMRQILAVGTSSLLITGMRSDVHSLLSLVEKSDVEQTSPQGSLSSKVRALEARIKKLEAAK